MFKQMKHWHSKTLHSLYNCSFSEELYTQTKLKLSLLIMKKEGFTRMRALIFTGVSLLLILIVIGGYVSSQGV
ncbi:MULTISPECIES: hypothetical protein [Metabacillus]|uniref:Uncharacterized protein n=2 Tax=Metabacillus TaxID=2675233 RepID=A0A179T3H4_9BACI|nr:MULTISPECIES: hypothetical protein [Metabacillus]OAS87639.1 hypothetical protein A6K24_19545 [Metabacillus litoralis]QNF26963.1 hypothetical protein HUW50_05040 [Metabacillus sp. KUDC1714]